jgi:formylglycine-generating enzyme required for sulfatase activity
VLAPDRILWEKDGKEMVNIPPGNFLYGDEKQERELLDFWIDRTPVTNAEYARFVVATDHSLPDYWESKTPPAETAGDPVVYVTCYDAEAYAEWAGKRLPTEEEWEKAARGVDGRIYPWGDWEPGRCNVEETGIHRATPVGQFSPGGDSPYGCVDMAGNVWEWTSSPWKPGSDYRVVRGGSWRYNLKRARCAYRLSDNPHNSHRDHGFRCAFSVSQP